jgi:group I intron endonuclease
MDSKRNMLIHKALLKYDYSKFKVEILEYCTADKNELITREEYYFEMLKPEYNILKKAYSRLGFVVSEETKAKMKEIAKNRFYSEERLAKFRALALNRSEELKEKHRAHLLKINLSKGQSVEVTNTLTNTKTIYPSCRKAAFDLGTSHTTILRYIKSQKLFKATYKISLVTTP